MIKTRFLLLCTLCIFFITTRAQPWMHEPYLTKSKSEANFNDIREAFYRYWDDRPYEKGKGYKQFKRWEYLMEPRCYPDGQIPSPLSFYNEYKVFLSDLNPDLKSKATASWMPLGLISWTNGESGYNPGNGRINGVTVNMQNRNIIYAAAASGGIWMTNDGGMSWNTTFDTMPRLGTSAIAIHPVDPNIIYVGTGDRDGWDTKGTGIYKSTDGGSTWLQTGQHFSPDYKNFNKIIINPLNPNTILAASNVGVYRSKNGGNNWSLVYSSSEVKNLKYKPNDTSVIYGAGDYFIRSSNGGTSFTQITAGIPGDTVRIEFDVTAANPDYVYALVSRPDNTFEGIYRSSDAGQNFTARCNAPNMLGYSDDGSDDKGQAWYDLALAVSPSNANEVFLGGVNVWKSTDGGANFNVNTMWYWDSPYTYIHCDIHSLDFWGDTLYCGSDGGVFYTPDHGNSWMDISTGMGISQFYRMGSSENDPYVIAAGAQDVGSNLMKNGQWTHVYGADGMEAIVDHSDSDIIYISYQGGGIMKSVDGGNNFDGVKPIDSVDGSWVTPYLMDPSNHEVLYAGYDDVYKTTNGGLSWTKLSNYLCGTRTLDLLEVAPSNPQYIYATLDEMLYKTTDGGLNWDSVTPSSGRMITGMAVDPLNPQRIWMTVSSYSSNRVLYSNNGGNSFNNITANLTNLGFNCIAYQKNAHDALYIGTEVGIFYTDTTLSGWIPYNADLPNVNVRELEISYSTGLIRAATYGRGIWEAALYNQVGIPENIRIADIEVFPNPADKYLSLKMGKQTSGYTEIGLFNITGQLLREIKTTANPLMELKMDVSTLTPGSYFLKIQSGGGVFIKKIMVLHGS